MKMAEYLRMDNQCPVRTYFKHDPHGNGSGEVEMYRILLYYFFRFSLHVLYMVLGCYGSY